MHELGRLTFVGNVVVFTASAGAARPALRPPTLLASEHERVMQANII